MTTFEDAGVPADIEEVRDIERTIHLSLPEDYRKFLMEHGGGRPVPDTFDLPDGNSIMIDLLYYWSPSSDKYSNISNMIRVFRGAFPVGFVPIGRDPGGNQILLGKDGDVFVWYHETGDWDSAEDALDSGGIVRAFSSFDDMISELYELEI